MPRIQIEVTDTFGGEANYSWVNRWYTKRTLTELQAVRLAKRLAGWTGHPCSRWDDGTCIELRPRGLCQVMFIAWEHFDDAPPEGSPAFPDDAPAEDKEGGK